MQENKEKKFNDWVWTELYRPLTLKDMLLPKKYKRSFSEMIKKGNIPNLLFYSSSPGTGKTSLAKVLCRELDSDFKYINISSESGIDTLRGSISKFASTKSFSGQKKIVLLDECDGASNQFQKGMRSAIEEFHKVCRFIFTCNYISQIIPPLRSRLHVYDMNYMDKETVKELKPLIEKRILNILKHKKVEYALDSVKKLIDTSYPDIRNMIQLCQKYSNINGTIDDDILKLDKVDEEFYDHIMKKKFSSARKYLIEKNYDYTEMYSNLYKDFVPRLESYLQPKIIIILAEYQYKHAFCVDRELNFAACLLEIMNSF